MSIPDSGIRTFEPYADDAALVVGGEFRFLGFHPPASLKSKEVH